METSQQVTLSTTTTGASIRYTTNGDTPTSSTGEVYSSPFTLTETGKTVKAVAYLTDMADSDVVTSNQFVITVKAPTITVVDSTGGTKKIEVSNDGTSGALIEYSTDGGSTWDTYVQGETTLQYSVETTVKFRISKTGLTTVEKTITVSWDSGSGKISYTDPSHYSIAITTPEGWTGEVSSSSVKTLTATWAVTPTSPAPTYQWYLDGVVLSEKISSTLTLKTDVVLSVGSHNIAVIGTVGTEKYSASIPVLVTEGLEFKDATWSQIKEIVDAGTYSDYGWKVGDYKDVTIDGTLGSITYSDVTIRAVILDIIDGSFIMGLSQDADGNEISLGLYESDIVKAAYQSMGTAGSTINLTTGWGNHSSYMQTAVSSLSDSLPADLVSVASSVSKKSPWYVTGPYQSYGTWHTDAKSESFYPASLKQVLGADGNNLDDNQLAYFKTSLPRGMLKSDGTIDSSDTNHVWLRDMSVTSYCYSSGSSYLYYAYSVIISLTPSTGAQSGVAPFTDHGFSTNAKGSILWIFHI